MKKFLLFASACMIASMAYSQSSELYVLTAPDDLAENGGPGFTYGIVNGMSANGEMAVICDEDNRLSYLWKKSDPNTMIPVLATNKGKENPTLLFDINNDGTMVGSQYIGDSKYRPTVCLNGEWSILDVPSSTFNSAYAYFISEDGKYIGGYVGLVDKSVETGSGYRPILWTRGDDGNYTYTVQEELPKEVATHQGFMPLRMSEDGSMIIGFVMCAKTQCSLPCIWYPFDRQYSYPGYVVEERMEPWYYKGQIWGYDMEYYINGYKDESTEANFQGAFTCMDEENGILYGYRTIVENVQEDGTGVLKMGATQYNLTDAEYTDNFDNSVYYYFTNGLLYGSGRKGLFVISNGQQFNFNTFYGLDSNANIAGVQIANADGTVVGGSTTEPNPATGEPDYFPMIIVDNRATAVDEIANEGNVNIKVTGGFICVEGAQAEILNINGQIIAHGNASVSPGIYIVKVGNRTEKVIVK